ncbi:tetraspanin-11-like [Mercurialis annua]|uniref:tetraspanin-11-like n=1 Tax=Mercurialis annua TaxID=3986 RepID=UPI00215ECCB7|nr:tetraspanin-11-like [Mercurialis annua]
MVRLSNCIISLINLIFLIFGITGLSSGLYIHVHGLNHCQRLMQNPLLIMGVFFIVLSLIGLLGSFCKDNSLLMIYLALIFFLIVGLMAFTLFAFLVTHKYSGSSSVRPGLGFKEYRLQQFSKWLQIHVVNKYHWDRIKSCMVDAQVCKKFSLQTVNQNQADFQKMKLTPIQSGCCKPPTSCNLEYQNATFWEVPVLELPMNNDTDCTTWNNNQDLLCYDCDSCKAGFLAKLRIDFRIFFIHTILIICFLMITYFIGCCARRSNKYRYVKYSPYISP